LDDVESGDLGARGFVKETIGEGRLSLKDVPEGPVEGLALLRRQFHVRDGAEPEPEAGRAEGDQKGVSVSDRCDRGLW
jgi:hypothetical protein